jgi:hypothetical protein
MLDQFFNNYISRPRALAFIGLAVTNQMNDGPDGNAIGSR